MRSGKCRECGAWIIPKEGELVGYLCRNCSRNYASLDGQGRGGEKDTLGKLSDITLALDFESSPTHVIDFDPSVETISMNGRNGEFEVLPVRENGKVVNLSLSNKTLIRQLKAIEKPSRLKITRSGTSYDTKYQVEVVK